MSIVEISSESSNFFGYLTYIHKMLYIDNELGFLNIAKFFRKED